MKTEGRATVTVCLHGGTSTFRGQATIHNDRVEVISPANPAKELKETTFNAPLAWCIIAWSP